MHMTNCKTLIPIGFMTHLEWLHRVTSACNYTPSAPLVALAGGISPLGRWFCN